MAVSSTVTPLASFDGVIAGFGVLVGVGEGGAIAGVRGVFCPGYQLDVSDAGDEEDVEEVAGAGSAEVGVGEAHNGGVGGVVAGAPVPSVVVGVGADLDGAEGDGGSGEDVAVAAGAAHDIDLGGEVGDGSRAGHALEDLGDSLVTSGEGGETEKLAAVDHGGTFFRPAAQGDGAANQYRAGRAWTSTGQKT